MLSRSFFKKRDNSLSIINNVLLSQAPGVYVFGELLDMPNIQVRFQAIDLIEISIYFACHFQRQKLLVGFALSLILRSVNYQRKLFNQKIKDQSQKLQRNVERFKKGDAVSVDIMYYA